MNETQPIPLTDLRVGNLVINPANNEVTKITVMDLSDIENGYKIRVGIPLTEEWLLKLGFSKEGDFYKHDSSRYQMYQDEILYTNPSYWIPCSKKLKSVHELMNAWYWITGTELTIK